MNLWKSFNLPNNSGYFFKDGSSLRSKRASRRAFLIKSTFAREAMARSGMPDCFMPMNSPGPRIAISFSASSKPSSQATSAFNRWLTDLSPEDKNSKQYDWCSLLPARPLN